MVISGVFGIVEASRHPYHVSSCVDGDCFHVGWEHWLTALVTVPSGCLILGALLITFSVARRRRRVLNDTARWSRFWDRAGL